MRLALFLSLLLSSLQVCRPEDQQFQDIQPEGHEELKTSSIQGQLDLPALLDEVKGLKELLLSLKASEVDQRQARRSLESRLRDREVEAEQQGHFLKGLQEMNSVLKRKVEELEERNRVVVSELPFLQTRLRAAESTLEQLRRKSSVLAVRLCDAEAMIEELQKKQIDALASNDSLTVTDELKAKMLYLRSRLDVMEEALNSSVANQQLSLVQGQLVEVSSRLQDSQHHLEYLRDIVEGESNQKGSAENQAIELQTANSNQILELQRKMEQVEGQLDAVSSELEVRLRDNDQQVEQLKTNLSAQSQSISLLQSQLTQRSNISSAMEAQLHSTEGRLEQLQNNTAACGASVVALQEHQSAEYQAHSTLLKEVLTRLEAAESNASVLQAQQDLSKQRLGRLEGLLVDATSHWEAHVDNRTDALQKRVGDMQRLLTALEAEASVQSARVSQLEGGLTERLNTSADLAARLSDGEEQFRALKREGSALSVRLSQAEGRLQRVNDLGAVTQQVAFSAGLSDSGSVGPFDQETTLIFTKTFANTGGAYNQSTGVFRAPLSGFYFFSFTAADYLKGYTGVYLYRNEQPVVFSLGLNAHGGYASLSASVVLQLQRGDSVRLALPASYRLYDDSRNFSLFCGFMLFRQ